MNGSKKGLTQNDYLAHQIVWTSEAADSARKDLIEELRSLMKHAAQEIEALEKHPPRTTPTLSFVMGNADRCREYARQIGERNEVLRMLEKVSEYPVTA